MNTGPIRIATTRDGLRIPFLREGKGIPFVMMSPCFGSINSLPAFQGWYRGLAERFDFVRYDGRGRGLAPRNINGCSRDDMQSDLLGVLEAASLEKIVLFASCQEAPSAIEFAVRCPQRVIALVLWIPWTGGGATGTQALRALIDRGTRSDDDWRLFLRTFATLQHHPGSDRELDHDIAILGESVLQADWAVMHRDFDATPDVLPLLPDLKVPTLVMNPRGAQMSRPSDALDIASRIPVGRAVLLDGSLIGPFEELTAPALAALDEFLADCAPATMPATKPSPISRRESAVLALVVEGLRNREIAEQLKISERTVERHVSNIYAKLGVRGKAEAVSWAIRNQLV